MAKRRKPAKKPSRSGVRERARTVTSSARERSRNIDQHDRDRIGLLAVAAGVFLGLVMYMDWEGGEVGTAVADALKLGFGLGAYVLPIALVGWGGAAILRPMLADVRAPGSAAIALGAGILLALAAQTAGLAGSPPRGGEIFDASFIRGHGGAIGESVYWACVTLFQRSGAHIAALLLIVSGIFGLTGREVVELFRASRARAQRLRRIGASLADDARTGLTAVRGSTGDGETGFETYLDPDAATRPDSGWEPPEPEGLEPTIRTGEEIAIEAGADVANYDGSVAGVDPGDEGQRELIEVPEPPAGERTPMGNRRTGGVTESDEIDYRLPNPGFLRKGNGDTGPDTRNQEVTAATLLEALGHFGVDAKLVGVVTGPSVSRYELRLAPGIKVSKVAQLKDDIAYSLAATDIRILAPIPGKQAVGVEVPNRARKMVRLGDIYKGRPKGASPLAAWLGKNISGDAVWTDLAKMPHLLVAGTTGSGKSQSLNTVLSSMLVHSSPNELRLVLVDPKSVELNHFERIPHLLTPLVTNPRVASMVLQNLVGEMESRYGLMRGYRCRHLDELNARRRKAGEAPLPYILCVIDELADLMMVAPAEVEDAIIRLAQKSRAVGIHLLLATQRPSVDVITGLIKANVPSRIAFSVSSNTDSRVILDGPGAEDLLGQGDMLFRPVGTSSLQRIQGALTSAEEIAELVEHWSRQGEPEFAEELMQTPVRDADEESDRDFDPDSDELLDEAIRTVVETQTASVSMIQRRLRVGYTRAGRLVDMLERRGVVSGYEGSKPRQVLVTEADLARLLSPVGEAQSQDPDPPTGEQPAEPDTAGHLI